MRGLNYFRTANGLRITCTGGKKRSNGYCLEKSSVISYLTIGKANCFCSTYVTFKHLVSRRHVPMSKVDRFRASAVPNKGKWLR